MQGQSWIVFETNFNNNGAVKEIPMDFLFPLIWMKIICWHDIVWLAPSSSPLLLQNRLIFDWNVLQQTNQISTCWIIRRNKNNSICIDVITVNKYKMTTLTLSIVRTSLHNQNDYELKIRIIFILSLRGRLCCIPNLFKTYSRLHFQIQDQMLSTSIQMQSAYM